jgi:hypothetical protein
VVSGIGNRPGIENIGLDEARKEGRRTQQLPFKLRLTMNKQWKNYKHLQTSPLFFAPPSSKISLQILLCFNTYFFAQSNGLPGVSPIFNLFKWPPILKNSFLFACDFSLVASTPGKANY